MLQAQSSTTYDQTGKVTSSTDAYGNISQSKYDSRGNVVESRSRAQGDRYLWCRTSGAPK